MRTSMKTALGLVGAVDPLTALYPFINDYDWALAQQYEHTTIGRVQYPFQDSGLTVPVTDVGDPVGGSVGLVGTANALQTSDASRPIWGDGGVDFSSSVVFLDVPEKLSFVQKTGTFYIRAEFGDWTTFSGGIVDTAGWASGPGSFLRVTGSGVEFRINNEAGSAVFTLSAGSLDSSDHYLVEVIGDGGDVTLFVDGDARASGSFAPFDAESNVTARIGSLQINTRPFDGIISNVFVARSIL